MTRNEREKKSKSTLNLQWMERKSNLRDYKMNLGLNAQSDSLLPGNKYKADPIHD